MAETKTVSVVVCLPTEVRVEIGWDADGMAEVREVHGRTAMQPGVSVMDVINAMDDDELAQWDREPHNDTAATAAEEA